MGRRSISFSRPSTTTQKTDQTNTALLGAVAGSAISGATSTSTPVITTCPPEDTTFMCKLTRFYNIFKMILSIIIIIILIIGGIWILMSLMKSSRGGKMKGGGCGCASSSKWL